MKILKMKVCRRSKIDATTRGAAASYPATNLERHAKGKTTTNPQAKSTVTLLA